MTDETAEDMRAPDARATLSPEKRAILMQRLIDRNAAGPQRQRSIPRRSAGEPPVLSFGQERLWFLEQLEPGEPTYNVPLVFRLRGRLDVGVLGRALGVVVGRHESLRTTFEAVDGVPVARVAAGVEVGVVVEDVSGEAECERVMWERVVAEVARPFDLGRGPLLRVRLVRVGAMDHVLCVTVHHVVADGWSVGVLLAELSSAYAVLVGGGVPELAVLPVQYADFAAWQREWLSGEEFERRLGFWARRLAGVSVLQLPTDRPRPAVRSARGEVLQGRLGESVVAGLRGLARAHRVSLFMVLTAAFDAVLARYSGQEDIVVGTTALGREQPELERLVGLFVNMVVLRTDVSGDPTFAELLERVRDVALGAFDHQDVPFEKVVERLAPVRDASRNPLFQVALQLLDDATAGGALVLPGVEVEPLGVPVQRSRFDLSLTFREQRDGLAVLVEYSTELFERARVQRLLEHLERVLGAVCADPGLRVSELPLVSESERAQLLRAGRGPQRSFRADPAHVVIAEVAGRMPDAIAAEFEGEQLSYAQLDRRADRVARYLRRLGVGGEEVVAVALERSFDALVALLGVLKAGAAFTVLDSEHPRKRLAFILEDSGARIVLTRSGLLERLPRGGDRHVVCLDRDWPLIEAAADEPLVERATGDSLAYVLYTSGSTGTPKGVLIEHRALMLYVASFCAMFEFTPADRLLQYAALVFDLSEAEIFSALTVGATLVLAPRETLLSPHALAELIRSQRVTYVGAPPAMLELVEPGPYPDLRNVLVGGEAYSGDLVNRWNLPGRRFINGYGPTEAAIGCTAYECEHIAWRSSPPIGGPLLQRRLYVVDRAGNLVPIGVPGELLIGGDEGLARGYLNQPHLTAERFIADPFRPHARVYRSGDLVRWTNDLQLEFLGRLDSQVKLHGLRIELEEIEAAIATHPHVAHIVVALREDTPGSKHLVAYYTPNTTTPSTTELRAHAARELPAYMIPSTWITLDTLPLTTSGKINRDALPAPTTNHTPTRQLTPPRTPTEQHIVDIFADILNQPHISTDDNFFELGGTSLQAIRAHTRLTNTFNTTLRVHDIYTATTITTLATHIDTLQAAHDAAGDGETEHTVVPFRASGTRPALFCIHPVSGSVYAYASLATMLDDAQPVYGLEAPGLNDGRPVIERLEDLASEYVAAIEHTHPVGPVAIAGWSMGGLVAFELACQLVASGRHVSTVVTIDTPSPAGGETPSDQEILEHFRRDVAAVDERWHHELDRLVRDGDRFSWLERMQHGDPGFGEDTPDVLRRRLAVFRGNVRAMHRYRPLKRYPGSLTLIRAASSANTVAAWTAFADRVDDHVIDGDHYSIWRPPHLPALVRVIQLALSRR
jgi:amino acid adenylation domain-containing protein